MREASEPFIPGKTCWHAGTAPRAAFLIDCAAYCTAFVAAALWLGRRLTRSDASSRVPARPTMRHSLPTLLLCLIALLVAATPAAAGQPPSDEYLRGYARAILDRDFPAAKITLSITDGVVVLSAPELSSAEKDRLARALSSVDGVKTVTVAEAELPATEPGGVIEKEKDTPYFLPPTFIFRPLLADPRWPHFSASYQTYSRGGDLDHAGAPNFGETIPLIRFDGPDDGLMDLAIQAGVFAVFDMDAPSHDLVNADYWVGLPLAYRKGDFSALARVFHQSSHLGDEFLLGGRADKRVNLSYESVDSILSYELPLGFRAYGGGGYMFHRDPEDLDPWSLQYGLELRSPLILWDTIRPVAALDVQNRQESGWDFDLSLRAGVQLEGPSFWSRKMQLLFEYYNGRSPNGQFYENGIEYYGFGVHFFYD